MDDAVFVSLPKSLPEALTVQPGQRIGEVLAVAMTAGILTADHLPLTVVHLNGQALSRAETLDVVLAEGDVVNIVVEEMGGGGGGKKEAGQVIFQIAVMVAAFAIAGPAGSAAGGMFAAGSTAAAIASAVGSAAATAAVLTAGQMIGAALFKPESQGGASGDRYALQSASNQYRPWSAMPLALGAVVVAPDLAVKTFTRSIGDDVWIYGILGLHYGPCVVSDMRIGDTLISSLPAGEIEVAEHLMPGPRSFSLYPNDTDEQGFTDELNTDGSSVVIHAAGAEGELFELDLFLPEGLYFAKDDGRVEAAAVTIMVRRRAIDAFGAAAGSWIDAGTTALTNRTREPVRTTHSVSLPMGRYEFELKRDASDSATNIKRHDTAILSAIRAIAFRKPIVDETLSVIEFRVKASAINQGTLAPITCRIEPVCDVWTGSAWTVQQPTSNPAALTRWLLTGPAPAKPLEPGQADTGLTDWYDACAENDWMAGLYITDSKSQRDAMRLLEVCGRAGLWWEGSRIVAVCWAERPAPTQIFSGRNLRERTGSVVYPEIVHGLRVEFANIDQRGEADEIIVYAPGFAAAPGPGINAASRLEAWRLEGQCTRTRAMLDGLWERNRRKLQRRVESWTVDVEQVACSFGQRVLLSWRAIGEGLGEARVRARRLTGGLVTGLRLDQPIEMEAGKDYAADLRFIGGDGPVVVRGVSLLTQPGTSREVLFTTPRTVADSPVSGDLVVWGIAGSVSSDLEIVGIEPSEDMTARLTGRKYVAPALMAAEAAAGAASDTTLTGARRAQPPTPVLLGVQGAPAGVRVSFSIPPWNGSPITGVIARWRVTPDSPDDTGWSDLPILSAGARDLITPSPRLLPALDEANADATLDVQLIVVTASGGTSLPLTVQGIIMLVSEGDPTPVTTTGAVVGTGRSEPFPTTASEASISAVAMDVFVNGKTLALPTAEIGDLDPLQTYGVFWRQDAGYEVELYPAPSHMTQGRWLFIGWQDTASAAGDYPPREPAPGGWGGNQAAYAEP